MADDLPSFLRKPGDEDEPQESPAPTEGTDAEEAPAEDDFLARLRDSMGGDEDPPAQAAAPVQAVPLMAEPVDDPSLVPALDDSPEAVAAADVSAAETFFNNGLQLHDGGDLDGALDNYRKAIEADPRHVVARNNLGMVFIDMEDLDGAEAALVETLRVDPSYAEAYNNLGYVYRRRAAELDAVWAYDNFLRLEPGAEDAERIRRWAESIREAQGEPGIPEALQSLFSTEAPQAAESFPEEMPKIEKTSGWEVSVREDDEIAHVEVGDQKIQKMSGWEVEVAPELHPENVESADVVAERGMMLFDQGDLAGAEKELRKAVTLDPGFAPAHSELGKVLVKRERYEDGVFELRQALQRMPDDPGTLYVMGFALRSMGKDQEAASVYSRFLELVPDAEEGPAIREWIASVTGEEPEAPEAPEAVEAPDVAVAVPLEAAIAEPVADDSAVLGDSPLFAPAAEVAQQAPAAAIPVAVPVEPEAAAMPDWLVADTPQPAEATPLEPVSEPAPAAFAEAAQPIEAALAPPQISVTGGEAIAAIPEGIDDASVTPADAAYHRALEAYQDSDMEAALAACEEAVALDEGHVQGNLLLGRVLIRYEDYLRAATALRRAADLAPENPEVHFFLGQAFEKRGLADEARESYQHCMEVAPDGPQADRVREWLAAAEEAGRASTGVRCEFCLRSFRAEDITEHDGKHCCQDCLNTLGVSSAGFADSSAETPMPDLDYDEFDEEEEDKKGSLVGKLFKLVLLLVFLAVVGAGVAFTGHHMKWFVVPDNVMKHDLVVKAEDFIRDTTGWPPAAIAEDIPDDNTPVKVADPKLVSEPPEEAKLLVKWEYKLEFENVPEGVKPSVDVTGPDGLPDGMVYDKESMALTWTPGATGDIELPLSQTVYIAAKIGETELKKLIELNVGFGMDVGAAAPSGVDESYQRCVASGDLNGDGRDDLVLAAGRYRSAEMRIFYQQELGGFSAARRIKLKGQPSAVAVVDLNGDARSDIVVTDWYNSRLVAFTQNANGDLDQPVAAEVGKGPRQMAVADLDGDGKLEAAVLSSISDSISVVEFDGDGWKRTHELPLGMAPGWGLLAAGNFSGDGVSLAVILAGPDETDQFRAFKARDGGGYGEIGGSRPLTAMPSACTVLASPDGDAIAALVGGKEAKLLLLKPDGKGGATVSSVAELDPNPRSFCTGDLNGDGVGDIVVSYSDRMAVFLGRAGELLQLDDVEIAGGCSEVTCDDASGDKVDDVLIITGDGNVLPVLTKP